LVGVKRGKNRESDRQELQGKQNSPLQMLVPYSKAEPKQTFMPLRSRDLNFSVSTGRLQK